MNVCPYLPGGDAWDAFAFPLSVTIPLLHGAATLTPRAEEGNTPGNNKRYCQEHRSGISEPPFLLSNACISCVPAI